jgi:urease accessory protein
MIKEIGKLYITVGANEFGSYMREKHFTPPFKIASVGEDRTDPACYLMTMSSSPGILDNDDLDVKIDLDANSRMRLSNQGYNRIFNMKKGARQKMEINLSEGSEISYVQHPMVPQEHSIFFSHNLIRLADNCIFTYGEVVTCGRKLSGEVFRFKRFQNITEVYHKDKLLIKDNVLLAPDSIDINSMGQVEGYTHQGTFMHVTTRKADAEKEVEIVEEVMKGEEGLIYGSSRPHPNVVMLRVLGNGGEQLLDAFKRIESRFWEANDPRVEATEKTEKVTAKKIPVHES